MYFNFVIEALAFHTNNNFDYFDLTYKFQLSSQIYDIIIYLKIHLFEIKYLKNIVKDI